MSLSTPGAVVALAGGVGGARLVDGLDRALAPDALRAVVNTGDDFTHWGLHISPDLDTIMYTLGGLSPEDRGWGIEGDTFCVLEEVQRRGGESWFQLGDRDLATHLSRTEGLRNGESLTQVTSSLCRGLGVRRLLLPMSDEPRPTTITTAEGVEIAFQDWLVRSRAAPVVRSVCLGGTGRPTAEVIRALNEAKLVVICPSNPYVSIDPILQLEGVRDLLTTKPTVAVSPIVGGRAVKGPLAAMIQQLEGREPTAQAVAEHYAGLLNGYVVHPGDAFDAPFPILETNILIQSRADRVCLARELVGFAEGLR